jgi:glycosyltransferase involved in cell wall biosynthesis
MYLISVVIPAYNRASVIERAVLSVLAQTFQNFEIIIVDDNSNDDTELIISSRFREEPRIRYFKHDINRGAQAARNTGIKAATGEWIAFLDSDDQWLPDSLAVRLELAHTSQAQIIYSECHVLRSNAPQELFGIPPLSGNIYRNMLQHPGPMFQSLLVTKVALESIDLLDESIITYQEWETAIRLSKKYEFAFLELPTFIYDCRGDDTMSKNMLRDVQGYQQIVKKHIWEILRYIGLPGLSHHYRSIASRYNNAGESRQAIRYRVASLLSWPFQPEVIIHRLNNIFSPQS